MDCATCHRKRYNIFNAMKTRFLLLLSICLLLAGCLPAEETAVPTAESPIQTAARDWPVSDPASQGMDPRLLEEMQDALQSERIPLHSMLILRNEQIVFEAYYEKNAPETKHVQFSVTKSVISTLIGIAIDQGKLEGVDLKVVDFFSEKVFSALDSRKAEMTVEDLLTMTSGLGWTEADPSFGALYRSSDWAKWMLDLPMTAAPGETFSYCSGCSHVLSVILQEATGENPRDFAEQYLFQPLGITDFEWETDADGTPIGGWGLYLTPRDMARLGALYLNEGKWGDAQILSPGWVKAATTEHVETGGRLGYGYQWWIYDKHNAYTALGREGQTIFVSPELDLIVVTTAQMRGGHEQIFSLIDEYILPSVTD